MPKGVYERTKSLVGTPKIGLRKVRFGVAELDNEFAVISESFEHIPLAICWRNMISRCYNPKSREYSTSHRGCSVDAEWHKFSNFLDWASKFDYSGKMLDKDIINPGNKIYSKENCTFVSNEANCLLKQTARKPGMLGAYYYPGSGRYVAVINVSNKTHNLGRFDTEYEAHSAWRRAKIRNILTVSDRQADERVARSFNIVAARMLKEDEDGIESTYPFLRPL